MNAYLFNSLRIFVSMLIGSMFGFSRERMGKPAGIKTHALVCLGGCLITLTGQLTFEATNTGDPMRLAAQVISGIGFLCAGVIMNRDNKVSGLTTAAGLWLTGCVGICIGSNYYMYAVPAVISYLFVTIVLSKLEDNYWKKNSNK